MNKNPKILVIIAFRGIGDLIYHLPLLRSLHASYKTKLIILSNKVNNAKHVYKNESFVKKIITFDNTRLKHIKQVKKTLKFKNLINSINCDKIYLTSNASRLVIPVRLSNAKEKIIFGKGFIPLTKDKKFKNLNSSNQLFAYTKKLNLKKKIYNFNLKRLNYRNYNPKKILLNIDSHHNQNNWKVDSFIKLINGFLKKKYFIYINYKSKNNLKRKFPKIITHSKNVQFTHNKNVGELIKIINDCKYVIGNESGPICLGSSLKKKVHTIYLPIHTEPESRMINRSNKYYNVNKFSEQKIISKILNSL